MYTADNPLLEFTPTGITIDPIICPITYSCAILAGPSRTDLCSIIEGDTVGAFDPATGAYTFNSIDMANFPADTYQMEITATSGARVESFTVNLVLTDPCPTSTLTLSATPFADETYVLRDPSQ